MRCIFAGLVPAATGGRRLLTGRMPRTSATSTTTATPTTTMPATPAFARPSDSMSVAKTGPDRVSLSETESRAIFYLIIMEGAHDRPERVNMPRDAIGRTLSCLVKSSVQIILISGPVLLCGYFKMHLSSLRDSLPYMRLFV